MGNLKFLLDFLFDFLLDDKRVDLGLDLILGIRLVLDSQEASIPSLLQVDIDSHNRHTHLVRNLINRQPRKIHGQHLQAIKIIDVGMPGLTHLCNINRDSLYHTQALAKLNSLEVMDGVVAHSEAPWTERVSGSVLFMLPVIRPG
jgi:hypothetical protein